MPVGSDIAGPSFGRHAVDQTPYTDTADRHRLLLEASDRTYAECLVTVGAILVLQSATGCLRPALFSWYVGPNLTSCIYSVRPHGI